jgi:hypothetical protein
MAIYARIDSRWGEEMSIKEYQAIPLRAYLLLMHEFRWHRSLGWHQLGDELERQSMKNICKNYN